MVRSKLENYNYFTLLTNISLPFPSLISEQHSLFLRFSQSSLCCTRFSRVACGFVRGFRGRKNVEVVLKNCLWVPLRPWTWTMTDTLQSPKCSWRVREEEDDLGTGCSGKKILKCPKFCHLSLVSTRLLSVVKKFTSQWEWLYTLRPLARMCCSPTKMQGIGCSEFGIFLCPPHI